MKFSTALGLAGVMVIVAAINKSLSAGYFAMILLFLILAALVPAIMVPIGVVIVIAELFFGGGGKVVSWAKSLNG